MSNRKNTDEIRVRGIRSGGYGQLPKIVMLDPNIPIASKGILAFFVSFTGNGNNKAFPTIKTILHDLNITSNTYYKHFNILVERGLISVEQKNGGFSGKGFKRNIYTIEDYSKTYIDSLIAASVSTHLLEEIVIAGDLAGAGYGNIPKLVMLDNRISVEAKALYAYICVFSGNSFSATPSKKTAMYHLNISSNTYAKYGRELEEFGYVARKRIQKDGKFVGISFALSKTISENKVAEEPHTKFSDTLEEPHTKISETIKTPHTKFSDTIDSHTKISRTINSATNNTSSLSKTKINTNCVDHSISRAYAYIPENTMHIEDRLTDAMRETVLREMAEHGGLPYDYCFNRTKLEAAIEVLTDAERELLNADSTDRQMYKLFVSALADMLDASTHATVIKGAKLSYSKIYDGFTPAVEAGYDECGYPYAVAFELYTGVKHRYKAARTQTPIKRPLSYMKAVIWTELTTAEVEIQDQIAYDFGGKASWEK